MTSSENSDSLAELASGAVAPIEQELRGRLDVEIGDRDLLAIESALLKAFVGGMRASLFEAAEAVVDRTGSRDSRGEPYAAAVQLDRPLPWLDPWADRYAEG